MDNRSTSGLDGRPREVFRHLVEAYITSGEPVGSRTLSKGGVHLSPANADYLATKARRGSHLLDGLPPTSRRAITS